VLFGVEPERRGHLWGFGNAMTEGDLGALAKPHPAAPSAESNGQGDVGAVPMRPGILLGEQLAEQLGAELGDEIVVLSPQAGVDTALGGGTVSRTYVVAGKFRTGLFNYDAKWAVVSLQEGRKFMPDYDESLDAEQYVTGVALNFPNPTEIQATVAPVFPLGEDPPPDGTVISGPFKGLVPLTWQKANKSLLFALKLEKFAMGSILMLIVVVAGFSISGTMMMTVFHRRGQVSLLRSLGMSRQDVARLYLTHGFTIGTVGILTGLLFGLAVCLLIKSFQFIPLPAGVYQLKSLPCRWLWGDYVIICIMAWLFSLAAAMYPAMTAARQDPGAGLRYL
jgi:lipoprotein-releasing system permease protein